MSVIEKSGISVEAVVAAYRKQSGLKDWEFDYEVISYPSKGFLGLIGKRGAKVRFNVPEPGARLKKFVQSLMENLGLSYESLEVRGSGKSFYITIKDCNDPGFLIGKNGSMLETLQYYINRVFEGHKEFDKIYLDSEGYRQRREDQFLNQLTPMINKVKSSGSPLTLDPMKAAERRIIHKYIERDKSLRTLTIGEGDKKRIVVFGSKQSEKDVLSQTGHTKSASPKAPKPGAKPRPKGPRPERPAAAKVSKAHNRVD